MEDTGNNTNQLDWRCYINADNWLEHLDMLFEQLLEVGDRPSFAAIATAVDIWLELMGLITDLAPQEQELVQAQLALFLPPEWRTWVDFTLDATTLTQPGLTPFVCSKTPVH
ncbi:hypothetical protein FKG94_03725 [Exilibacterium tricleocarpae]|uniref:Uncharacterized protein n=1 Tax=Exilibacterium tricleocarpae TaxID=2591008 RepID=A0A545U592_9GAMM|nr:hypothetical protein [Exilibacterium tricleocarpae]TQV84641.1 hypothetical protein FKG94_03725 [Exilibacterium tricleocarpae]